MVCNHFFANLLILNNQNYEIDAHWIKNISIRIYSKNKIEINFFVTITKTLRKTKRKKCTR